MNLRLPSSVASPQDLSGVLAEIRIYATWYIHESIKQRVSGKKSRGSKNEPILSAPATDVLRAFSAGKPMTRQSFDQLIRQLEDFGRKAPVVTFTLAAPATGAIKEKLVSWCRQNVSDGTLVTFQHNATILGGLVMRYKSRVFDWSFRRALLDKANTFPEVLRRV